MEPPTGAVVQCIWAVAKPIELVKLPSRIWNCATYATSWPWRKIDLGFVGGRPPASHKNLVGLAWECIGAKATFTELIPLRLRRMPVGLIVDSRITAVRSGLPLSIDELSTHFLAGGNVPMVVLALVAAKKAGIHLDFDRACAIDLATKGTGKFVIEAVRTSINPQAEANKLIAQAHAEIRRAAAVAVEQEMTARVAEMRARVVEAEAKVPLGMAAAFRSGKIGLLN